MAFFKNLFGSGIVITGPLEVIHTVHIDTNLNWTFDKSVDPKSIFTKLKILGKGGFGTVLQVVHRPSMKVLAGKHINPNLVDENSKAEIEHEIELMKAVDSPYTVHYYGCITFEGSLMILMEYCDRGSLRDLLDAREQVLSEDQISIIIHDLLKGLELIHKRHRIVHRDIKAANILMTTDAEIKIADFGVSRQFDSGACQTMTIVGTPYWMAPEVITGVSYSFPADIWSTGITAVELAEGAPPYIEYSPTKAMIEIAIKGFPGYRFPSMHSPDFTDFVSHCVTVNPMERWNVEELLEHPFIKRAERLPRAEVLRDLLKPTKSKKHDTMDYSSMSMKSSVLEGGSSLAQTGENNSLGAQPQQIAAAADIAAANMMDSFGGFQLDSAFQSSNAINLPSGTNFAPAGAPGDLDTFSGMAMMMSARFEPGTFKLPTGAQVQQQQQQGGAFGIGNENKIGSGGGANVNSGGGGCDSFGSMNMPFALESNPFDSLNFASFNPGAQGDDFLASIQEQQSDMFGSLPDSATAGPSKLPQPSQPTSLKSTNQSSPSSPSTIQQQQQQQQQQQSPSKSNANVGSPQTGKQPMAAGGSNAQTLNPAARNGPSVTFAPGTMGPDAAAQQQQQAAGAAGSNGFSDLVFVKVSRAMSLKIPFIPMKMASNNDVDVSTLYRTGKGLKIPGAREAPLFDDEGVLNISRALREKKAPPVMATVLILMVFFSFGREGFMVLATLALVTNLLVIRYRKERKEIIKRIEEGSDDGPIN